MLMWVIFRLTCCGNAIDFTVFHRDARRITLKQALAETAVWIGLALVL